MEKLTLIKVGGKIVEETDTLNSLLDDFVRLCGAKVLVHGGGRSATTVATQLGITTQMIDGRRVTDEAMLRVVTMVYGGLVNKQIVAGLQQRGLNALGLTGADMNYMLSEKRPAVPIDYGFVGDVKKVDGAALADLIAKNIVPVLAPLTHDGKGNLLNTNADTIAGEAAKALARYFDVTLVYCLEKKGVLLDETDENSVIPHLTENEFERLKAQNVIVGGMVPKLTNAFAALKAGVRAVVITKADDITKNVGTRIE